MLPFHDVMTAVGWYVALFLFGVPGFVLVHRYARPLKDSGFALGKALGVIGMAAVSWVLCLTNTAYFVRPTLIGLLIIAWAMVVIDRKSVIRVFRERQRQIVTVELITLLLFVAGVVLRMLKPEIHGIEKFMDSGVLNSLLRTTHGTPIDQWYAPNTINYYYFGHWIVAMFAKLVGTPGWTAFNLGQALTMAIAGSQICVIGWTLARRVWAGILGVFMVLFASNMHPFVQKYIGHNSSYFFFASGRFSDFRINEYPLYSLTLGDLHAHMLALMLTTTVMSLAVLMLWSTKQHIWYLALLLGLCMGLLGPTNSFDVISTSILVGLVLTVWWLRQKRPVFVDLLQTGVIIAAAASVPLALFFSTFTPPTGGVGVAIYQIPIVHIVWQFGLPASMIIGFGALSYGVSKKRIYSSPLSWLRVVPEETALLWVFALCGLILVLIPEFVFLKDIYYYTNPPYKLANTVFKIWYTGWVLLGIAAAVSAIRAWPLVAHRRWRYGVVGVIVLIIAVSLVGVSSGLDTVTDNRPNGLDGISYLDESNPDKATVVRWVNQYISGQPITLEATGDSYSDYDWFSAYTGLPTLVGWRSHEFGWRYTKDVWPSIAARQNKVKAIYESKTASELKRLSAESRVDYVLFGPDERQLYTTNESVFIEAFGEPVFSSTSIRIYQYKN